MRNYELEVINRVRFIQDVLSAAETGGVVYGNSGGKDSTLVGILCKLACDNTVGIVMPCGSRRGYEEDKNDAEEVAHQFDITTRLLDLSAMRDSMTSTLCDITELTASALSNMAPRLRMMALYAVATSEHRLVAGTGNRSEAYMGYFTKWGDGAYDFNPIADLTVLEIFEFLRFLDAPSSIVMKAPSAGLFDGQTDETEMGISYQSIDQFLLHGMADEEERAVMERFHKGSEHKRQPPVVYAEDTANQ